MRFRFLPAVLLAGCVPASAPPRAAPAQFAGEPLGAPKTCFDPRESQSLTVIDRATVGYRDGATLWVNRLVTLCPGLTQFSTIILERSGTQVCRGDVFRTLGHGSEIPSGHCVLGDFTPYRAL